jgi:radical SAM protein with 4Fe4S-binding SPASM domain
MITKIDKLNKFISKFNPETGLYIRSGVIEKGVDTGVDPFMTQYPELIDIGIRGFCQHSHLCTIGCYQGGSTNVKPDMTLEDYKMIIDESKGAVFQVALGGHGDPNKHENFEEILRYTREAGIVPNYTTSGLELSLKELEATAELCGAVAVSWYRAEYTLRAIKLFLSAGMKTNIHYVLGNDSIDEAIWQLQMAGESDDFGCFPKGINAVIFLMHKPVGLGRHDNVLTMDDPKVKKFFDLVDKGNFPFKIGFDSCSVPGILNMTKNINHDSLDTCEGARWSMYITPDMKAVPCSFDQSLKWAVDIKENTIEGAWNSEEFWDFRDRFNLSCKSCVTRKECMGGCPIAHEVVLCDKPEKDKA